MRQLLYLSFFFLLLFGCSISEEGVVEVVPLAPSELKVTIAPNGLIDLTWKDIATNETGYKIERKTDSGIFSEIGAVSTDITTFQDKSINPSTNYTYRIYSFNKAGKSALYSLEVSIKTINYLKTGTPVLVWNGSGTADNQFKGPSAIFVDAAGNIYVSDTGNQRIMKWAPGATSGIRVAGASANTSGPNSLSNPQGIWVDAAGNIFIADSENHRIQKKAPNSNSITVAGGNGNGAAAKQLNFPYDVSVNANGLIYAADTKNHRIMRWAPGATSGINITGSDFRTMNDPYHIFVDAAGNIYVSDWRMHRVQKWAPGATIGTTVAGGNLQGAAANQFYIPGDIFVDAAGNIYVLDTGNSRVQKWAPGATSGVTVAGGNGPGTAFYQVNSSSIFVDTKGNIYLLEGNRISKWTQ
jgi:streptogramin lyase